LAPAAAPVDLSQGAPVIPGTNDQWARGFDDRWLAAEKERRTFKPIADNSGVYALDSQRPGHTYGNHTERETALWAAETERLVVEGSLIFHDANLLGSKNGVSCDMCHPDAEGTHAETYPKYQVQLGRPALLRDMSNWRLTQPASLRTDERRRPENAVARSAYDFVAGRENARIRETLKNKIALN
jgi:hypothetical protein